MAKKSILIISVLLASMWFWATVKPWLYGDALFAVVDYWLQPLIALIILSTAVALSFLLVKELRLKLLASILSGLPFFIVFGLNYWFFAGLGALVLVHLYAMRVIKEEATEHTKMKYRIIFRRGLPHVITPILIMISFAYFFSPKVQTQTAEKRLPPTVDQVIEQTISTFLGDEIKRLPAEEQEHAQNQLVGQIKDEFVEFAGPYFRFMPPILAFGLFLILTGLSTIFVWASIGLSVLTVWIFRKTGLVQIKKVQVEAEQLEF
ncbi:MAG: hypothetical protein Q8Q06_02825 [bacterium]|nr:hypothetical protein [bacterium]